MEHLSLRLSEAGLHIEGFPNAVKAIHIDGPLAKQFADFALHKADLEFAAECLASISLIPDQSRVLRQALWRSAIIHYIKCFGGNKARSQLSSSKIYKDQLAIDTFNYFRDLRNKHIAHDDNAYAQGIPGAILNGANAACKIEKIVCIGAVADTLDQPNFSNLHLLIQTALALVISKYDWLCRELTADLEAKPYDELLAREAMTFMPPGVEDVGKKRNPPNQV